MAAIIGLVLFGMKISLTQKLFGHQVSNLLQDLSDAKNEEDKAQIVEQIRQRTVDMDVVSLLIACCEDVPQILVVVIMINGNAKWNAISVLNLSVAVVSFSWKLLQVPSAKLGCKDPHAINGQYDTNKQMEMEHTGYEKPKMQEVDSPVSNHSEEIELED